MDTAPTKRQATLNALPDDAISIGRIIPKIEDRLKARWAAVNAISGDNLRNSYEQADLSFERDGRFNRVSKDGITVAIMTPQFNRKELYDALISNIQDEAKLVGEVFTDAYKKLNIPDEYSFRFDVERDIRDIASFHGNQLSAYIGLYGKDTERVPDQLAVELRVFLDSPRAHVFATKGPRFFDQNVSLLQGKEPFVYAESYEELAYDLVTLFNEKILSRADLDKAEIASQSEKALREEQVKFTALAASYKYGQLFEFKPGDQIVGNGYRGTVKERYSGEVGKPGGMVNVRLPGGEACLSASFPDCYPAITNGIEVVTDGRYIGKVEEVTGQFVVQNVGRDKMIAHEIGKFETPPQVGEKIDVQYVGSKVKIIESKGKGLTQER